MRKLCYFLAGMAMVILSVSCSGSKYKYESVPNDPLKARIYTLDNGLKVYLSVNKDKPRIQTFIAVRVGGKNDPAETTGLSHYLEHLMFKGTTHFGTTDYEAEKPLLDQIVQLFEKHRATTDPAERKAIYAQIDSISQAASKIAIPNEYDKLMSAIGSQGTNAFTSYDLTAYTENIPSNEIENWARIEADRFTNPVFRLFHTELETVYEEYNMSLTRDGRKVYETMLSSLFTHHPYGKQTVLGKGEHLKNPSLVNIKKHIETYYVPNNMAVCMAGDFDPDSVIAVIDKYFGSIPAKEVPELKAEPETPVTAPIVKEVVGLEAANLAIGYRTPAANTKDAATLDLISSLLYNGKAGLIDLNLVQKQKVLRANAYMMAFSDYGVFQLSGTPKQGQSLDEVRDLLLGQIEALKKGDFKDDLLEAAINNYKLDRYYQAQEPEYAAYLFLDAFINKQDWKDQVNRIDYLSKLTKQDIVDFANKTFGNNYAVIYKKEGKADEEKIEKPHITPIAANRDEESKFLAEIKTREVKPIEPVFLDYNKDLGKLKIKQEVPLLYKKNETNPLFSLTYVFEMGNNNDKALGTAFNYLNYLGTSTKTAEEIKSELYKLACSFGVSATDDRVYVYVNGLSENFDKALQLLEERLADAKADPETYANLTKDILKRRADAKLNQQSNFSMLRNYAFWGSQSPATNILSEAELTTLNPEELVTRIKNLKNYEHKVLYYGPLSEKEITKKLNEKHALAATLQPVPPATKFIEQDTKENQVLLANYDAKQIYLAMVHKGGGFDRSIEPVRTLYNNYFGGNMNSIVFQEMREARGLAYSAGAGYNRPSKPDRSYYMTSFIATQSDKMKEAIEAFNGILNELPVSEKAFGIAKESILTDIRTGRILREDVLWNYLDAQEFGYDTDSRIELFEKVPALTLDGVKKFQESYIKSKPYTYCILGNTKNLDLNALKKIGKVTTLTQQEIFGY